MKLSYKEIPFQDFFIIESLLGLVLWGGYGLLNNADILIALQLIPITLISALLSEFFVFYAYTKGDLNIIDSIFATYPFFTMIFSFLILNEQLSATIIPALILVLAGIVTISFNSSFHNIVTNKASIWAIAAAIAVGFSDTLSKLYIDNYTSYEFIFSLGISQVILSLIILSRSKRRLERLKSIGKKTVTGAFLIAVSMIFFWETFNSTLASIASPLTGSVVILTVILSRAILKERIPKKNYIGIISILLGVSLIK